jgi:hypothetical protein
MLLLLFLGLLLLLCHFFVVGLAYYYQGKEDIVFRFIIEV